MRKFTICAAIISFVALAADKLPTEVSSPDGGAFCATLVPGDGGLPLIGTGDRPLWVTVQCDSNQRVQTGLAADAGVGSNDTEIFSNQAPYLIQMLSGEDTVCNKPVTGTGNCWWRVRYQTP